MYTKSMDYIINTSKGAAVYQNNQIQYHPNKTAFHLIKSLCLSYLFSYEGYVKACSMIFKFHYKIPLHIDRDLKLIPTSNIKSYDNIWINYANIKTIESTVYGVKMTFYSGLILQTHLKVKHISNYERKLKQIEAYKVKHFH